MDVLNFTKAKPGIRCQANLIYDLQLHQFQYPTVGTSWPHHRHVWWVRQPVACPPARYHGVNNALADGFVPMSGCTVNEDGTAAMGIHFIHIGRAMDPAINKLEREVLLYAPTDDKVRLVGVGYLLGIGLTDIIPRTPPAPELFDESFDDPLFGHEEGMPSHYDIQVWLWEANPDGMFTMFNPNVKCQ